MVRVRLGGRGGSKIVMLLLVIGIAGWKFVAQPAMIRAEEWTGTVISKDTGRPFFSSSRNRRNHYYLTVDCGDKDRTIEVNWRLYNDASKGRRAVKVKGELYPRLP